MQVGKSFNIISAFIFTFMGCFLAANQCLVENIATAFGAGEAQIGLMISSLYGGSIAAVLFLGELAQRAGKRRAAFVTAFIVFAGSVLVLCAGSVAAATVGFFVYGTGIGGYESSVMSIVTDNNKDSANRFLNFLQAMFSAGAVLTPLLVSMWLKDTQFRPVYAIMAAIYAGSAVYWLTDKRIDSFVSRGESSGGLGFLPLLKNPLILAYMGAMMVYLGAESAVTYWIKIYFGTQGFAAYGAAALSVYWFASIFGRILGIAAKSPSGLMAPCFALGGAGCAVLLIANNVFLKLAAVALTGLAFAPLYAGLSVLAGTLVPEKASSAFSLTIFAAGVGGIAFQPVISHFVSSGRPALAYMIVTALCAVAAVLMFAANRGRRALNCAI